MTFWEEVAVAALGALLMDSDLESKEAVVVAVRCADQMETARRQRVGKEAM